MKDDKLYLVHMIDCVERIETYTRDGRDAYMGSTMAQDAVIRNFEIIGEAAKRVSDAVKQANPAVPWRRVAGLRDVLIHDYSGVDLDEVWSILSQELPAFKRGIEDILRSLEDKS